MEDAMKQGIDHSVPQILVALLLVALAAPGLMAQRTESMDAVVVPQNRITMRDLGWPPVDVIPEDENGITSLVVAPGGSIYGGTTGFQAHLFVLKPAGALVRPLGKIPGAQSIHHALVAPEDGLIYFGTSLWNRGRLDQRGKDIAGAYKGFPGGHIYRFEASEEEKSRVQTHWADPSRDCPGLTDLGIPVPGDGVHAMVGKGNELYGVSFPGGVFFVFDITKRAATFRQNICGDPIAENPYRSVPRDLVIDSDGNVWGTGDYGKFFRYDPAAKKITQLDIALPCLPGREFMNVVDSFALAADGKIYGGDSDGYVFCLDPKSAAVGNLGKPLWQKRIRGLAVGTDGNVYGVGGEELGIARLFVYRTASNAFEILGLIEANHPPYYNWLANEFDDMVTGRDGTIYIGENSRRAHLFIFYPWQ
jgi:outer membrane protein assembly factor BamB